MRITLDGTPLLGRRTGIGTYVARVLDALPAAARRADVDVSLEVMTWSLRGGRVRTLPDGVRQVGPPVPARVLREAWARWDVPPVEALVGGTSLVHGTNFVSPPTRRAREVVTVHDLAYVHLPQTVSPDAARYRTLVPRALGRGAQVVVPSAATAAAVRDHYALEQDRVSVTPLGVDPGWADARPPGAAWRERRTIPERYVLFVGTLEPRKNLPRLLQAHRALRRDVPDAPTLVLAGQAGAGASLGDTTDVVRTGWLEDDELRALVAGAQAVLLPSLDEGFGLPVLEAFAAGRPVLAGDVPALREVGGGHATYADPRDVEALAAGLERVLTSPDDAPAQDARRAWAARFTWDATADATLAVYRRALS
ncbi:glycosyltransferase family 4 protein [Cellulomonas sp. S1-8]|uniref:glycosyltransferase family 4 protein n=1 Tax=Cellulomonas sp. S1-8 TaxID=2904790 RepID=UPI002244E47C|nr:glycosyltransferase family 1 protein [Cellulomonas sp. S1-8]UZN01941.1 glycosyltransferase family 4 protein [Cellulomonas sp. S1-8]